MIRPSRSALGLALFLCILAGIGSLSSPWAQWWLGTAVFIALLCSLDLLLLLLQGQRVEATLQLPGSLPVGVPHTAILRISHHYRRPIRLLVKAYLPIGLQSNNHETDLRLATGEHVSWEYQITPVQRGKHQIEAAFFQIFSPLGCWQRHLSAGQSHALNVYPNFAAIVRYSLLATDHRLGQLGVLQRQRRGEGLDFRQLREYREGDTPRQIDWKASSRMRKLISREYQDERDQQVMFLLDCGRRMQAKDSELSHFDHTLNAMLLLSYVALKQGDAVGLSTFATSDKRFLAPKKSEGTVNLILNQVFDLHPTLQTSDYYQAAIELSLHLKKRSLIVILSNLRDEDDSTLLPALGLLRKKHLVVFASLTENSILASLDATIHTELDALAFAANADFLNRREEMLKRLNHQGTIAIETPPEKLAIALVNQYLDLKMSARF